MADMHVAGGLAGIRHAHSNGAHWVVWNLVLPVHGLVWNDLLPRLVDGFGSIWRCIWSAVVGSTCAWGGLEWATTKNEWVHMEWLVLWSAYLCMWSGLGCIWNGRFFGLHTCTWGVVWGAYGMVGFGVHMEWFVLPVSYHHTAYAITFRFRPCMGARMVLEVLRHMVYPHNRWF